jgi:metallo-beta-lactamase family protein
MKWSVRDESLHSKMGCRLFRHMCDEYPELKEDAKKYVEEAASTIIQMEHKYIDKIFEFPFLTMTENREDSMKINSQPQPKMIMAGSGMSTGGRVLYHEERYLSDPNNIILFVGYQAPRTLGRRIQEGESPVYIHNHPIDNKIEIRRVEGYSAHADKEMLLDWLSHIKQTKNIFVVQGEQAASESLANAIKETLHIGAEVPIENQVIILS